MLLLIWGNLILVVYEAKNAYETSNPNLLILSIGRPTLFHKTQTDLNLFSCKNNAETKTWEKSC